MKIAVATRAWETVSGHAGQTRTWLVFDLAGLGAGAALPAPMRVELTKEQVFHHFHDDGPHPLDGVEMVVTASAGDGFVRHMKTRGADVVISGESDPRRALELLISGEAQPDPRFDVTTTLCRLRDLFSRY